METKKIINKIKQVLEDYKGRAVIDCEEGECPNNCLECGAWERETEDFYTEAVACLDSLVSNAASCLPISPRDIQTDKYPFKAVSFREGRFELVNVQGYSDTVGWVIESKRKCGGNTCYFLREIFPLRED